MLRPPTPRCDRVLAVDAERQQVTVQAGARIKDVVEALRPHGLTLQNYASIAEQQVGGFLQVGAHGTGAAVPPVDEQVVRYKLHTPALGALELTAESHPRLFWLAKVGLGLIGANLNPNPTITPTLTPTLTLAQAQNITITITPALTITIILTPPLTIASPRWASASSAS